MRGLMERRPDIGTAHPTLEGTGPLDDGYADSPLEAEDRSLALQELEKRLPQPPFLRVHRAFIVNLRNVVEIRPYFNGAYLLKTNDAEGTELTVSRGRVASLRSLLGL
jgi:hypothetical protein